jgi:hypothetical protein
MPLPDALRLCAYWRKSPPTHVLVASYLGVGEAQKPAARPVTKKDIQELGAVFGRMAPPPR